MDLLIKAESNLRQYDVNQELLGQRDLTPMGKKHLTKRSATFLEGFFEAIESIVEGMKPDTARPLTRKETIEAVSDMTNMAIAELTAKNN